MGKTQEEELFSSLKKLYQDGTYSDLTVKNGDNEYHVHQAIVCSRSNLRVPAPNDGVQEPQHGTIDLPDDEPLAVRMMMHYFYHLDYPHVDPAEEERRAAEKALAKALETCKSQEVNQVQDQDSGAAQNNDQEAIAPEMALSSTPEPIVAQEAELDLYSGVAKKNNQETETAERPVSPRPVEDDDSGFGGSAKKKDSHETTGAERAATPAPEVGEVTKTVPWDFLSGSSKKKKSMKARKSTTSTVPCAEAAVVSAPPESESEPQLDVKPTLERSDSWAVFSLSKKKNKNKKNTPDLGPYDDFPTQPAEPAPEPVAEPEPERDFWGWSTPTRRKTKSMLLEGPVAPAVPEPEPAKSIWGRSMTMKKKKRKGLGRVLPNEGGASSPALSSPEQAAEPDTSAPEPDPVVGLSRPEVEPAPVLEPEPEPEPPAVDPQQEPDHPEPAPAPEPEAVLISSTGIHVNLIPNLTVHTNVYALSRKYDVAGLEALSLEKFSAEAEFHWSQPDFLQAAELAYDSTPATDRDLRDVVAETLYSRRTLLGEDGGKELVKRVPGLAYDVLMRTVRDGC